MINRRRAVNAVHQVLGHNRIPQVKPMYRQGYETAIKLAEKALLSVPEIPHESMLKWTPVSVAMPEDVVDFNERVATPYIDCLVTTSGYRRVKHCRRVARRRGYGIRKVTPKDPICFWEWIIDDRQDVIAWCIPEPYDGPDTTARRWF